jgi:hypothetical protein
MAGWRSGDVVYGPYLVARNNASSGIHTDEFAQSQGFERAVVAGPNFLTFVSTLLEDELGPAWRERGRLSARFTAPVYDQEQVRAVLTVAGEGEAFAADFVIEKADGASVVATGSAAWTPADAEETLPPPAPSSPVDQLLDLNLLRDGERVPRETVTAKADDVARFRDQNHDRIPGEGRVPVPYLSPLLFLPARAWMTERGVGPGMWGQIDVRQHRALRPDTPYRYEGTVRSRRRRGALEIVDFAFAAREQDGTLVCAIAHTHLIPHRDQ